MMRARAVVGTGATSLTPDRAVEEEGRHAISCCSRKAVSPALHLADLAERGLQRRHVGFVLVEKLQSRETPPPTIRPSPAARRPGLRQAIALSPVFFMTSLAKSHRTGWARWRADHQLTA